LTPEPVDGDTDEQRGKAGCAASCQAPRVGLRLAEAYCRFGYFRAKHGWLRPTDFLGDAVNFVYAKATLKFLEYPGIWIVRVPTQMKEISEKRRQLPVPGRKWRRGRVNNAATLSPFGKNLLLFG
jgi:hypothetical protein